MNEGKKKRGRPRKYPNSASRQKAYYERKKKEHDDLKKRVRELEELLEMKDC